MDSYKSTDIFDLQHILLPDGPKGPRICAFCGRKFQATTSTSNLRYHLRRCKKAPPEVLKRYSTTIEASQSTLEDAGVKPHISDASKKCLTSVWINFS